MSITAQRPVTLKDPIWGIILLSLILHLLVLPLIRWQPAVPPAEKIIEIELIKPEVVPEPAVKRTEDKKIAQNKKRQVESNVKPQKVSSKDTTPQAPPSKKSDSSSLKVVPKTVKASDQKVVIPSKKSVPKQSQTQTDTVRSPKESALPKEAVTIPVPNKEAQSASVIEDKPKPVKEELPPLPPLPPVPLKPIAKPGVTLSSSFLNETPQIDNSPIQLGEGALQKKKIEVDYKVKTDLFQPAPEITKPNTSIKAGPAGGEKRQKAQGITADQVKYDKTAVDVDGKFLRPKDQTAKYTVDTPQSPGTASNPNNPANSESGIPSAKGLADSFIEGEVSKRKILSTPAPPSVNIEKDVTVSLQFKVLPNGNVTNILPYRKAEPELELLAIRLLQQYKFEPLFGKDIVQSGIIHFTIYRNQ